MKDSKFMQKERLKYHAIERKIGSQNRQHFVLCDCVPMFRIGKRIKVPT